MDRFKNSLLASILLATLWAAPVSAFPDNDGLHRLTTPIGGVAFEVVGQVTNFLRQALVNQRPLSNTAI